MNPSEDLDKNVVLEVLEKLQIRNIDNLDFTLEPINKLVGLSENHAILQVSLGSSPKEKKLSFFVKLFPQTQVSLENPGSEKFEKEIFFYNLFDKIHKNAKILKECVPEIYLIEPQQFLVMENLLEQFTSLNKYDVFNYSTLEIILNALAKFHASSLIFEEKNSCRIVDQYPKELEKPLLNNFDNFHNKSAFEQATFKSIINCINSLDFSNILLSGKDFQTILQKLCEHVYDLVQPSKKFRNVISHGNLHTTNILIKYEDKKPKTSKFVNFQYGRYAPPAQDVLSLIYSTTSRDFRSRFMYNLIGTYYTFLEKYITLAGYDLRNIIPMEDFLNSCEEQKKFVLIQTAVCLPVFLLKNEVVFDYFCDKNSDNKSFCGDRSSLVLKHMDEDDNYKRRIRDTLQDLKDFCDYL